MRRLCVLVLILSGWFAHSLAYSAPFQVAVPVLSGPVEVVAQFADTSASDGFAITLVVKTKFECFEAPTTLIGPRDLNEAIHALRRTMGWKGKYLFVRTDCGGGNAWKCRVEEVFMLRGGRLFPLGSLAARGQAVGTSYDGRWFQDIVSDWKDNDLADHANARSLGIDLREAGGRLKVDLNRSWQRNLPVYRQNQGLWQSLRDSLPSPSVTTRRTAALFGNAVIATYCRHSNESAMTMNEARRVLPPEIYRKIIAEVGVIKPGALPRTLQPAVRRCGGQ